MHYPEHLKKAVLAKAKDLPLEGFVEGQGPPQPKLGKPLEKKKLKKTYHL